MPRLADHDERRREAIEALWQVIAEEGIAAVSQRSVAARTGWSRGIIDYYFANMDELRLAGLRTLCDVEVESRLKAERPAGRAGLRAALMGGMPVDDRRRLFGRVWIAYLGAAASESAIRAEYARCQARRGAVWQTMLARMVERGELAEGCDLELEATHLMAFELAMNVYGMLNPGMLTASKLEQHADGFLDGLLHPGG